MTTTTTTTTTAAYHCMYPRKERKHSIMVLQTLVAVVLLTKSWHISAYSHNKRGWASHHVKRNMSCKNFGCTVWGSTNRNGASLVSHQLSNSNDEGGIESDSTHDTVEQDRRTFLERGAASIVVSASSFSFPADARGLVRFPCKEPLLNTYHFLRAGLSLLEIEDIWSTNPLFL